MYGQLYRSKRKWSRPWSCWPWNLKRKMFVHMWYFEAELFPKDHLQVGNSHAGITWGWPKSPSNQSWSGPKPRPAPEMARRVSAPAASNRWRRPARWSFKAPVAVAPWGRLGRTAGFDQRPDKDGDCKNREVFDVKDEAWPLTTILFGVARCHSYCLNSMVDCLNLWGMMSCPGQISRRLRWWRNWSWVIWGSNGVNLWMSHDLTGVSMGGVIKNNMFFNRSRT